MLINTVLLEINWNCGKFLWIELKYLHTHPPPPLTIQCPASTGFMLSNNMCNQNAVCFCNRHILLLYNRWQKMKLIFSICICNACLCTMNLYNVTARQNDRPFVLQGPGWHNVFWRPIWKIIFMYRMRRISIIRITELLIHAEILGFVWFLPISDVFYFLPLKFLWSSAQTFPVILAFLHIFAGFKQFLFQKILNTSQRCICIQDLSKTLHHQTCGTGLTC